MAHLIYALIALGVLCVGAAAVFFDVVELKDLVLAVLPIASTFLGATLAFRLTEQKDSEKEELRRKQALDYSLFVLLQQDNAIQQIARPYLDAKSDAERAFLIPAYKPPDYTGLRHDLSALAFLLETGSPQILFELAIEQERFAQVVEALRVRNDFYVGELQPALDRTGMIGRSVSLVEAEALLGKRVFSTAMNQAHFVHEHLVESKVSLPSMFKKLRVAAKGQFPNKKFVDYEQ